VSVISDQLRKGKDARQKKGAWLSYAPFAFFHALTLLLCLRVVRPVGRGLGWHESQRYLEEKTAWSCVCGTWGAPQEKKTQMITVLREQHEPPKNVAQRLKDAGGLNRFGEANYRVVWGWNRLAWIGGKFEDRDEQGRLLREVVELRQEPKYPQVNRWHVERWVPPEAYGSPRVWYAQTVEREGGKSVAALGPYPQRGEYEHCFTLEGAGGEFLQLTPTIVEQLARAIEWSRLIPKPRAKERLYEREARDDRDYGEWAYNLLDDAVPAFHRQPFVTVQ